MHGWRGKIGHVKPSILDNYSEWAAILPDGVVMVINILGVQDHTAQEFDAALERIESTALTLSREKAGVIIVGGSPVLEYQEEKGDKILIDRLEKSTGVPCSTTRQVAIDAMRALGIKRVAVATPWKDNLNENTKRSLEHVGFEVLRIEGLQIGPTVEISELPSYAGYRLARDTFIKAPEAEGIYIPCARWQVVNSIQKLESDLGVPVVTSVQAMIWFGLKVLNIRTPIHGFGRLLEEKL